MKRITNLFGISRDKLPRHKRSVFSEIIGRVTTYVNSIWSSLSILKTLDKTRPDYEFWDKFRHGKSKGFAFSGLLARPVAEIVASWVVGMGIQLELNDGDEYTNGLLARFVDQIHGLLWQMTIDLYGLGDQYVVINPDDTLSLPSPDTVTFENDPLDYRKTVQYTITTKLDKFTVLDVYTETDRKITIKNVSGQPQVLENGQTLGAGQTVVWEFSNLLGAIPIVHFANERKGNEIYGRPIYEPCYTLFSKYDDLLLKMITGAELMGNPIPVFEGMNDIDEAGSDMKRPTDEEYDSDQGDSLTRQQILFDRDALIMTTPGVTFKFAFPGAGFTKDIRNVLKVMFMLILEFTRIPEAVWGTELSSARATAVEQMKTFFAYIEGKRLELLGVAPGLDEQVAVTHRGGLLQLTQLWLQMKALTDRKIKLGQVVATFTEMSDADADLNWRKVEAAHNKGIISNATYLMLLDIVTDPDPDLELDETNTQPDDSGQREELERSIRFDRDLDDLLEAVVRRAA